MKLTCPKAGTCLLALVAAIVFSACGTVPAPQGDGSNNLPPTLDHYTMEELEKSRASIGADGYLEPGFVTHLPVMAIEFLPGASASKETDWYNSIRLTLWDDKKVHALTDPPTAVIPTQARVMADPSEPDRLKQDYYLRLYDEGGASARHGLLGLAPNSEFFLIGSMYDPSLLRNYLGYTLAARMMENTPGVRFCEVVLDQGEQGYQYQGVYLLIENTDRPDTVALRRTTKEQGFSLQTYGSDHHPGDGRMELPFYAAVEDEAALWETLGQLSHIEEVIYSDDLDTFSGFANYIHMESFLDFFLINELMGNYAAKTDAFYRYHPSENLLESGPVWNFEQALDNSADQPMEVDGIRFDQDGYYGRLIKSRVFLERLKKRYLALRQDVLNEQEYNRLIDDAMDYLGPALERDWKRWAHHRDTNDATALEPMAFTMADGDGREETLLFARQPRTAQWESRRIRYLIREHDLQMAHNLAFLEADIGAEMIGAEASYVRNTWLFLAFVAFLAVTIHYVRRYGE